MFGGQSEPGMLRSGERLKEKINFIYYIKNETVFSNRRDLWTLKNEKDDDHIACLLSVVQHAKLFSSQF